VPSQAAAARVLTGGNPGERAATGDLIVGAGAGSRTKTRVARAGGDDLHYATDNKYQRNTSKRVHGHEGRSRM
jgi:hypothetical protein